MLFKLRYRQADAFDGNRSLVYGVLLDFIGQFDVEPPVLRVSDPIEGEQLSDAVDVPLNNVAAKTSVGLHGQFQVHQRSFVHARKRRSYPCLRGKISAERSRLDVERG